MDKNDLIEQLQNGNFRKMNFTVFNFIDDNGYIIEIDNFYKRKHSIDDFQFMLFAVDADDKRLIKNNRKDIMTTIRAFKYEIENERQKKFSLCRIFIMKDLGIVIAVKPKSFNIASLFINN